MIGTRCEEQGTDNNSEFVSTGRSFPSRHFRHGPSGEQDILEGPWDFYWLNDVLWAVDMATVMAII